MTARLSISRPFFQNRTMFSLSFNQCLSLLRRTLFASVLAGLIWLPGLSLNPLRAEPIVAAAVSEGIGSQVVDSDVNSDRRTAFLSCLPKQLSQPSFKRAWSEMGNDQLERAFNLKANPRLSLAETEMESCLSQKGYTL
jgi:hypothetical protein